MEKEYSDAVSRYFRDSLLTLLALDLLILAVLAFVMRSEPENPFNMVFPALAVVLSALWVPTLTFHRRVLTDLRNEDFETRRIVVQEVALDKKRNLYGRGGVMGREKKYLLTSGDGEVYAFSAAEEPDLRGQSVEITFLKRTKFVLAIKA